MFVRLKCPCNYIKYVSDGRLHRGKVAIICFVLTALTWNGKAPREGTVSSGKEALTKFSSLGSIWLQSSLLRTLELAFNLVFYDLYFSWLLVFWTKTTSTVNGHGCDFLARAVLLGRHWGHWKKVWRRKIPGLLSQTCASPQPLPPGKRGNAIKEGEKGSKLPSQLMKQWTHIGSPETFFFFHFSQLEI